MEPEKIKTDGLYTAAQVKEKIEELIKTADFIDFNPDYGIFGWSELRKWMSEHIK